MRPRSYQVIGDLFVVVWDDEHESYYPLEGLRRACPCAVCSGEPDLFGRMYGGAPQHYRPDSFVLQSVEPIGNYALQLNWADGHTYGIWTFERLRALCADCAEK
jgi:DUF971 family protein